MTDRELLELAAKVAGHKIYKNESKRDGILIFKEGRQQFLEEDGSPISLWNPLTDDGDAFGLSVDCRFQITVYVHCVVIVGIGPGSYHQKFLAQEAVIDGDRHAATRRAITRAAAALSDQRQPPPAT